MAKNWEQMTFAPGDGENWYLPDSSASFGLRKQLIGLIYADKLWKERPSRARFLVLDQELGEALGFHPNEPNEIIQLGDIVSLKKGSRIGFMGLGLVMPAIRYEQEDGFKLFMARSMSLLQKYSSLVYVIESVGSNWDKEWRRDILKELGLAKVDVLDWGKEDCLFWRGRLPKKREVEPVNRLEVGEYWQIGHFNYRLGIGLDKMYEEFGYTVIDRSEIEAVVTASTNFLIDKGRLDDGNGVTIESIDCGCCLQVGLKGDISVINSCGDVECDGGSQGLFYAKLIKDEKRFDPGIDWTDTLPGHPLEMTPEVRKHLLKMERRGKEAIERVK